MRSHTLLGMIVLVSACGGGTFYTTLNASPTAGPADVVSCARGKLKELGYQQASYDEVENRMSARKIDNTVHRPDPLFRRNVNRIEVETAAGADGKTAMKVVGHTFAEFETQRGPTEVEERASTDVTAASQAVVSTCGQA